MRISDWSSDVCSSDLFGNLAQRVLSMIAKNCDGKVPQPGALSGDDEALLGAAGALLAEVRAEMDRQQFHNALTKVWEVVGDANRYIDHAAPRSEEHTSELQSLMRISYAVFCLKKNKIYHRSKKICSITIHT